MREDQPDRLVGRPPTGACNTGHRHGDVNSEASPRPVGHCRCNLRGDGAVRLDQIMRHGEVRLLDTVRVRDHGAEEHLARAGNGR